MITRFEVGGFGEVSVDDEPGDGVALLGVIEDQLAARRADIRLQRSHAIAIAFQLLAAADVDTLPLGDVLGLAAPRKT